jgi:hypothetical protein
MQKVLGEESWKGIKVVPRANEAIAASREGTEAREVTVYEITFSAERISSNIDLAPANNPGGIDFNAKNMNVEVKGKESDKLYVISDNQKQQPTAYDLELIADNIQGFVPVIISIVPVTDFMGLLGLKDEDLKESDKLSAISDKQQPIAYNLELTADNRFTTRERKLWA